MTTTTATKTAWWITDGNANYGGAKILGPFESRDLALTVRTYFEAHSDAMGLTYWVSEVDE